MAGPEYVSANGDSLNLPIVLIIDCISFIIFSVCGSPSGAKAK